DLALQAIAQDGRPRGVHVAPRSLLAPGFARAVLARLKAAPAAAQQLSIEWAEQPEVVHATPAPPAPTAPPGAAGAPSIGASALAAGGLPGPAAAALREAVPAWRRLGVRVGVEHAGGSPRTLPALKELGIDYVKVDARHLAGAADDAVARNHVESLVALIHGLELAAIAEGVADARQLGLVWELGFDGATGPAVVPAGESTPGTAAHLEPAA
ncbi:MAG: EAL domain-containing protein, partial [Rubrivivax sp.]|nr:EAL domain-containing protein [Rubrivivax sp.]